MRKKEDTIGIKRSSETVPVQGKDCSDTPAQDAVRQRPKHRLHSAITTALMRNPGKHGNSFLRKHSITGNSAVHGAERRPDMGMSGVRRNRQTDEKE